ncbi:glutathione peroxidase [Proteobacteria bacterium 005FR1]|nr:glutathione peroxidase [Proteobacteria bacterium 005FR1]
MTILSRVLTTFVLCATAAASQADCGNALDFEARKLHSSERVDFCEAFKGKTLLVVNTASQCGFTPQFEGLEALYQKYKDKGFAIVGFPSDDFNQEHADEEKTASVCYLNFGVTFPMVATSSVKGQGANPFFQTLIAKTGQEPSWNFNKYLVSADFGTVKHFGSRVTPLDSELEKEINALLNN